MAKVSELKFTIAEKPYKVNVNCGVDGMFKANLPQEVANALNVRSELKFTTLKELESEFYKIVNRYKTAETKQEFFIAIAYQASGRYVYGPNNNMLFGGHRHKYQIDSFSSNKLDGISFEFETITKETVDGAVKWFKARIGNGEKSIFDDHVFEKGKLYKVNGYFTVHEYHKIIPYSEVSLKSLKNARLNLQKISELLFNFIEQDEKQIEISLSSGKLLG